MEPSERLEGKTFWLQRSICVHSPPQKKTVLPSHFESFYSSRMAKKILNFVGSLFSRIWSTIVHSPSTVTKCNDLLTGEKGNCFNSFGAFAEHLTLLHFLSSCQHKWWAEKFRSVPMDRWKDVRLASGYFIVELKILCSSWDAELNKTELNEVEQSSMEQSWEERSSLLVWNVEGMISTSWNGWTVKKVHNPNITGGFRS